MKTLAPALPVLAAAAALASAPSASADPILYNNDTPTSAMAMASRPGSPGMIEIEAADDFLLTSSSLITSGSFTGLLTGGTITGVGIEIYRVFPLDSTTPPPPGVVTRVNSPSDNAFASRDSASSGLSFTTSVLSPNFTALNSVLNGINPSPNQRTGGDGPVTGNELHFGFTLTVPLNLAADHYFFVPQVEVSGGEFYWLSASRPISGVGTTPFTPDLQTWIRNENLEPNWSRVGTDIVGGATPPTYNAAFSLSGTATTVSAPDTGSTLLLLGLAGVFLAVLQAVSKGQLFPPRPAS